MANTVNYAEAWQPELLEIMQQNTLCTPFITPNVRWLDAKTFHFTQMTVGGYKNHDREGGWNRGHFTQTDVPFTVAHDRDIEFLVDRADVDESNAAASIRNISRAFAQTQASPETDALFFSKVAAAAKVAEGAHTSTARAEFTKANIYGKLKTMLSAAKLRRYKAKGALVMYLAADLMDLLEQSEDFTRTIAVSRVADGGEGVETRVTDLDGVPIFEVIDDETFYDAFDFAVEEGGFVPAVAVYAKTEDTSVVAGKTYYTLSGGNYTKVASPVVGSLSSYYEKTREAGHRLNVLIASPLTTKVVPKISSIYYFAPGAHTCGDGYLYQNRALSDVFVFPNGKDGTVDSVFADTDTTGEA
ncbi:MAG: phage capsid protein [Gemmiger sp.]|nr:phage capsid protein [Gemmiger sp.]